MNETLWFLLQALQIVGALGAILIVLAFTAMVVTAMLNAIWER